MNCSKIKELTIFLKIRLTTIRKDLTSLFAIAIISVCLNKFWLIDIPASNKYFTSFGEIYITICYSYIASFIFYFLVVHLPKVNNKVKSVRFLNNKTLKINNEVKTLLRELYHYSGNKYNNGISSENEISKICTAINPKNNFVGKNEISLRLPDWFDYLTFKGRTIKGHIHEIILLKDALDADYLGVLTIVDDLVSNFFLFEHRKYANTNLEFMSSSIRELSQNTQELVGIFMKNYKKYLSEYHIEARKRNKKTKPEKGTLFD